MLLPESNPYKIAEEMTIRCEVDGYLYPESEMVFDKDGTNWVHQSNIKKYLVGFERDMLREDFLELKHELYKQLKNK